MPSCDRLRLMNACPGLAVICLLSLPLTAQQGDVAGEAQPPLPAGLAIPPATPLSWEEELRTFEVPPGFAVELVAAEPLIHDPVAMAFGTDGRLWVVEMRGYMNDLAATGEAEPVGTIAVLEDTDGDGRMDERVEFADKLVLPRAIVLTRDGALVIAPPEMLFLQDTDDDGIADERTVVDRGLGGIASPEHAINGLLPTLDNAFACANVPWRYIWRDKRFQREASAGGGQWGITQDDRGRLYFNDNSDPLRGDRIAARYGARNPNSTLAGGVNERIAADLSVKPRRVTPGVNRGYRPNFLVEGKLAQATGTCAPLIFRGGTFPKPYDKGAFVCEPTANLVLAYGISEQEGKVSATPIRHGDGAIDFLTSTDERFRPVNLCDGPDGALYVADMYRGLIQHRLFVTSFLRKQVEARGLEKPIGFGRIWRVRNANTPRVAAPDFAEATWVDLSHALEHENGWIRDRVQQIFVEEGAEEAKAHAALRDLLASSKLPLARLHAIWALSGMRGVKPELSHTLLADPDERVREAAVRTSELLVGGDAKMLAQWLALARGDTTLVRTQVLFSLGEVHTDDAERALFDLMVEGCADKFERTQVLSSLAQRESFFLGRLLDSASFEQEQDGRAALVRLLAATIARERNHGSIARVLEFIVEGRRITWQRDALVNGLLEGRSTPSDGHPAAIRLVEEPRAFRTLTRLAEQVAQSSGAPLLQLSNSLSWPGHPLAGEVPVRPLDEKEVIAFERGRAYFAMVCASCHQSTGRGLEGMAPPLRDSEWVLGDPATLARFLLAGLSGPITVRGQIWNLEMPATAASDEEIAGVLTYVRREWGHPADPVTTAEVRAIREQLKGRKTPFTASEAKSLAGK